MTDCTPAAPPPRRSSTCWCRCACDLPPSPAISPAFSHLLSPSLTFSQVDPNFNIYEVALPWAIQRALSPSTDESAAALRSNLLDGNNELRWEKLVDLASKGAEAAPAAEAEAAPQKAQV